MTYSAVTVRPDPGDSGGLATIVGCKSRTVVNMRATLTDFPRLDIGILSKRAWLEPGSEHAIAWKIAERVGGLVISVYPGFLAIEGWGMLAGARGEIELEWSATTFGSRPWLTCPACRTRRSWLVVTAAVIACRGCSNYPYLSASLGRAARRQLARERVAARCGTTITEARPRRPKWMRETKWQQLLEEWLAAELDAIARTR